MPNDNILEMRGITKRFPGVLALDDVSLTVKRGEIHALVGENGAGKSTLMKVLSGIYKQDAGTVVYDGKERTFRNAMDARNAGISLVHQEPQIVPSVSIAENICLGDLPGKNGFVDFNTLESKTKEVCDYVGIQQSMDSPAEMLSMGEQQLLQFARALFYKARLVIMDEPTSSLTELEKKHIFQIIRKLNSEGTTFIYITHRMEEIFEICDEATIMKDGKFVKTVKISETDKRGLVNLMVGREVGLSFPNKAKEVGETVLKVEDICRTGVFKNISFEIHRGEVVGFGGLIGAGRTEIMDAVFGMYPKDSGRIYMLGEEINVKSPIDATKAKMAYITEDRHSGLILHASILENMTLASLNEYKQGLFINESRRNSDGQEYKEKLRIKAPNLDSVVNNLSGGNQQKVIFAKWLLQDAELYIFDEPTRGVDVGAKEEMYKLIRALADDNKAVIVISSEMPELIGLSDRIIVIHEGEISGELSHEEATESAIIEYATGIAGQA